MEDPNKQLIKIDPKQALQIESFKERLRKREIWINGPITDSLVEVLFTNLIKLHEQSKSEEITVVVNSNGGNFYESIVATDTMGTLGNPIKTIALANAVSGGFILFMGGQLRICHDYTCLMMHSASFGVNEKVSSIEERVKYTNYAQEKMAKFFSIQTEGKTTPEYWLELFRSGKDKWFSIEEAIKLGIVHKVIKRQSMIDPDSTTREPFTWDLRTFSDANQ
jgi:ATP-dependent Clp protease protease subunit